MKRRLAPPNPHGARASGDRWLFGYADIVTLLLAVFASLYAAGLATSATPSVSESPARPPEPETVAVVAEEPAAAALAPPDAAPPPATEAAEPAPVVASELALAFEDVVGDSVVLPGVEMTASTRGLVISLPEAGSFPAGSADLSASARLVMTDLALRLRDLPNLVRVEGHTDDVPIATAQFASNWDLSTARATRVVALLIDAGIDPGRLSAAGYGEHRPRLANDSAAARARNRRVDIVVLDPVTAGREEPEAVVR